MNREIKFRAWNIQANRYSKPFSLMSNVLNYTDDDGIGVIKSLTNESIEQFTGLQDAEINGKDIYDGDIIQNCDTNDYQVVYWNYEQSSLGRIPASSGRKRTIGGYSLSFH